MTAAPTRCTSPCIDSKLALNVRDEHGNSVVTHILSLTPFRRILKDYFMICESYYRRDPHRDAQPDRSDRHGPARTAQRRRAAAARTAEGQDRRRLRTRRAAFSRWSRPCTGRADHAGGARDGPPGPPRARPQSILFACTLNTVRSPMAEALARHCSGATSIVASAGLESGEPTASPWRRWTRSASTSSRHKPRTFEELEDSNFDLIVTLSPEAHHRALEFTRTMAVEVIYWPTPDPTAAQGSREAMLDAYRDVRERLGGAHQNVRGPRGRPVICWRDDFRDPGAGVAVVTLALGEDDFPPTPRDLAEAPPRDPCARVSCAAGPRRVAPSRPGSAFRRNGSTSAMRPGRAAAAAPKSPLEILVSGRENFCAVAMAPSPIGVDIEPLRDMEPPWSLLHRGERDALANLGARRGATPFCGCGPPGGLSQGAWPGIFARAG